MIMTLQQRIRKLNHDRIDAGRALSLKIVRFLFDHSGVKNGTKASTALDTNSLPVRNLEKILVYRLDGKLGDCITSTGFLQTLHRIYPQAEITVVTSPATEWVYKSFEFLKVVSAKKGLVASLKIWFKFQNKKFDILINTTHVMKAQTVFLCAAVIAKHKISFVNSDYPLFTDYVQFNPEQDHVSVRYQKAIQLISGVSDPVKYVIPMPNQGLETVDAKIKFLADSNKKYIILNSFAGARYRNFNEVTTLAIIQLLSQKLSGFKIVSIANHGDMEILKSWKSKWEKLSGFPRDHWIIEPDCTSFFENCRWVEKSNLVITPDTSIVHMASAFQRPVVAVFRPDLGAEKNALIWAPYLTRFKVIYSKVDSLKSELDINDLDIHKVLQESQSLLAE